MVTLAVLLESVIGGVGFAKFGAAIGAALTALAAAFGIGKIGSSAMEGISRQPEAAGDVRSSMIVACALIEGVSLFAVVVCLLILFV